MKEEAAYVKDPKDLVFFTTEVSGIPGLKCKDHLFLSLDIVRESSWGQHEFIMVIADEPDKGALVAAHTRDRTPKGNIEICEIDYSNKYDKSAVHRLVMDIGHVSFKYDDPNRRSLHDVIISSISNHIDKNDISRAKLRQVSTLTFFKVMFELDHPFITCFNVVREIDSCGFMNSYVEVWFKVYKSTARLPVSDRDDIISLAYLVVQCNNNHRYEFQAIREDGRDVTKEVGHAIILLEVYIDKYRSKKDATYVVLPMYPRDGKWIWYLVKDRPGKSPKFGKAIEISDDLDPIKKQLQDPKYFTVAVTDATIKITAVENYACDTPCTITVTPISR